jgi:hypothetical protein
LLKEKKKYEKIGTVGLVKILERSLYFEPKGTHRIQGIALEALPLYALGAQVSWIAL